MSTTIRYSLLFVTPSGETRPALVPELEGIPEFEVETCPNLSDETKLLDTADADCVLLSDRFCDTAIEEATVIVRNHWPDSPVILALTDRQGQTPSEEVLSTVDDCLVGGSETISQSVLEHRVVSTIENSQARAELHRHRDFLRRTQELGNIGGWEYHLEGSVLRWTEQVYEIYELPHEYEPTVDNALGFYHEKDRPQLREKLETLFETGESFSMQVRLVTAERNVKWVRVRGDAEISDGQVKKTRGVVQDVTSLVEQRTETAKLRESLRDEKDRLQRLSRVLSHELRNPLTAIHGQLQLYHDSGDQTHLETVERNVDRLEEVIDDTLWLVHEEDTVSEMSMVDVSSVAHDAWRTVGIDTVTLTTDSMERIPANRSLLQTVFEKLFENTLIHSSASEIEVGPRYMGDHLDGFYVEDNGDGFDTGVPDELFEVGVSGDGGNSGIGLSVVQEIVDRHDWSIVATDSETGGARFEIKTSLL